MREEKKYRGVWVTEEVHEKIKQIKLDFKEKSLSDTIKTLIYMYVEEKKHK